MSIQVSWSVEQRLTFLEHQVFWEGGLNRSDLIDRFNVSVPQASNDLSKYQEIAPDNIKYDRVVRRYFATDSFKPKFISPDPEAYLEANARSADKLGQNGVDFDGIPRLRRRICAPILQAALSAMRERKVLSIQYVSMSPDGVSDDWRSVSPHAFGNDGLRWHVRAFCHRDQKFKDFILSRCRDARVLPEDAANAEADNFWHETLDVELIPNPKLSQPQQQAIADDFKMIDGVLSLSVRYAMLYYFQRRYRLDLAKDHDRPAEAPLVIRNETEFNEALQEAMS